MVKVVFYNLLRSKYRIEEELVHPGTIQDIVDQILRKHEKMSIEDFMQAVFFYKGYVYHYTNKALEIEDNQTIKITHFVGGG